MALYSIIYDWLMNSIFTDSTLESMESEIMGVTINFNQWLGHTCTLVILGFALVAGGLFVRWLFREFSSMFSRIGG